MYAVAAAVAAHIHYLQFTYNGSRCVIVYTYAAHHEIPPIAAEHLGAIFGYRL